jgi:fluoride exporter
MEKYLVVLLGGAVGSLARYLTATAVMTRFQGRFPLGTLIVNLSGCFLIGVLAQKLEPYPAWRLFLIVGILGGYTTFSGFAWETFAAVRDGSPWIGLLNVTASVILGYLAVWLGTLSVSRY